MVPEGGEYLEVIEQSLISVRRGARPLQHVQYSVHVKSSAKDLDVKIFELVIQPRLAEAVDLRLRGFTIV